MKNLKNFVSKFNSWKISKPAHLKAQSLVEFAITLPVLLMLLSGVTELGYALNYYLSILDATREAARFYSGGDPDPDVNPNFYSDVVQKARGVLDPTIQNSEWEGERIQLDPSIDDVIVTTVAIDDGVATQESQVFLYSNQESMLTLDEIEASFESGSPNAGLLIVEIHYKYERILPWMGLAMPDPFMLRAYTIMPLDAIEPEE